MHLIEQLNMLYALFAASISKEISYKTNIFNKKYFKFNDTNKKKLPGYHF